MLSGDDQARLIGSPHSVLWTIDNVKERRAFVTTIGARKSFENPNVQRLYHNAIHWCLGRDVPEK